VNNLSLKKWQQEGFIFQDFEGKYWIGQGPFSYSCKADFQTLYQPDFFLQKKKPWIKANFTCCFDKAEMTTFLFSNQTYDRKIRLVKNNFKHPSFIKYQEIFYQVQQTINQQKLKKVVPVVYESFDFHLDPLFLIKLLFKNVSSLSHGFLYGIWTKGYGILGFTPEILFSLKGKEFVTMALAGTAPYPGPSLLHSSKDIKEHEFVVQGLQDSLKNIVKWKKISRFELLFPPLKHLQTELKGQLTRKTGVEDLCQMMHPTPAVGGYPQKQALEWLKHNSLQNQRTGFGAPICFFKSPQEAFCVLALRALEWSQKKAQIFSGSGLIKESVLQNEWKELFLKRKQVEKFFQ